MNQKFYSPPFSLGATEAASCTELALVRLTAQLLHVIIDAGI